MTPQELDERLQIGLGSENFEHHIEDTKLLIRDCIKAVTPKPIKPRFADDEGAAKWSSGHKHAIDTIEAETRRLLG